MPHVPHRVKYCIAFKIEFGCHLRTMKAPESLIPLLRRYGWTVIATESELETNEHHTGPDGYSDPEDGA